MKTLSLVKVALLCIACNSTSEPNEIHVVHYSDGPRQSEFEVRRYEYAARAPCFQSVPFIQGITAEVPSGFQLPEKNIECRSFSNQYRRITVNWNKQFLALETTDVTQFAAFNGQQYGDILGEQKILLKWDKNSVEIHDPNGHIESLIDDPEKSVFSVQECWNSRGSCQESVSWYYSRKPPELHTRVNAEHSYLSDPIRFCIGLP